LAHMGRTNGSDAKQRPKTRGGGTGGLRGGGPWCRAERRKGNSRGEGKKFAQKLPWKRKSVCLGEIRKQKMGMVPGKTHPEAFSSPMRGGLREGRKTRITKREVKKKKKKKTPKENADYH